MSDERTGPRLTVGGVARRLGIAPATLRTWDRRYGIGPSQHAAGAHRSYTTDDLTRLESMRRLVLEGVRAGEAARTVLSGGYESPSVPSRFPDRDGRLLPAGPAVPVPPVPGAAELVRGLSRASTALDSEAVLSCVADQLAEYGVVRTWEHVLVPVLFAAGVRWETTGEGVEVEHLLSDCVATALRRYAPGTTGPERSVLLACTPGELHSLPLLALSAALSEAGIGSRVLGAAVPPAALLAALRRTAPAALFLWSQLPAAGGDALLAALPVTRPATAVVVGGPGWAPGLPQRVSRADRLGAALALLAGAVRGEALASTR